MKLNIILLFLIFLIFIILLLLSYLLLLKKQLRELTGELRENRQDNYNKQLRLQLFDEDLTNLAKECNYNLDFQTECKRKALHQERSTKQSISDIAHDLRTPLTVVKGNLQMIQKNETLCPDTSKYLQIAQSQTEELKQMVDEFFELSLLESDDSIATLSPVNITSLLFQAVLERETLIREKKLEPQLEIPEKTVLVLGDAFMLERIVGNLLGNILKYGRDSFTLRLTEEEDHCVIEFQNPLENADAIDVSHLFHRSYMADSSRQTPGTGLGLYIVKLLTEKQGGRVSAKIQESSLIIQIKLPLHHAS